MAEKKDDMPVTELSAMSRQTMANTYWGMDYYFDNLRMVIASVPSGGSMFGEMVKAYAEKNIDTTQEFARQLSQAKDLQQILQIQMEFMQAHLQAFEEEARIFSEAFTKVGSSITKK